MAGLNYLGNLNKGGFTTDQWHARRPSQPIVGTEECAFNQTRGIYFDDPDGISIQVQDTRYRGGVGRLGDRDPA